MKFDVFVSYSRKNSAKVLKVYEELKNQGVSVWIDTEEIHGGVTWREEIVTALIESECVVFFLSKQSSVSEDVAKELTIAVEDGKRIIPVVLDGSPVPQNLRFHVVGLNYIDGGQLAAQVASEILVALGLPPWAVQVPSQKSLPPPVPRPQTKRARSKEIKLPLAFIVKSVAKVCLQSSGFYILLIIASLISASTVFVKSWRIGRDRGNCINNIRNSQQAVRAYQQLRSIPNGAPLDWNAIFRDHPHDQSGFVVRPSCPGNTYMLSSRCPPAGFLACKCSDPTHIPANYDNW